ncbi:MAG: ATP-dependent Clp protease ATP-binding subunit ClpA, partial [Myxococcota bacterium]
SPEFRNRLDEIVIFEPLEASVMNLVVDKFVGELKGQLAERKISIELAPAARELLAERGYDPDFGARPLARIIQRDIVDAMADEVLFGSLDKGGRVKVDAEDGEFTFDFSSS